MLKRKGRSGSDVRLKREVDAPAFRAAPEAGEREDRVPRRSQVGDLGLVTGRAQPGLRQQHDVDAVVLNEGGDAFLLVFWSRLIFVTLSH